MLEMVSDWPMGLNKKYETIAGDLMGNNVKYRLDHLIYCMGYSVQGTDFLFTALHIVMLQDMLVRYSELIPATR